MVDLPETVWLLITAAAIYPFIHIRHLSDAGFLSYIGVVAIAVVNGIVIVRSLLVAIDNPAPVCDEPFNLFSTISGLTVIAFAFGGHVLMVCTPMLFVGDSTELACILDF